MYLTTWKPYMKAFLKFCLVSYLKYIKLKFTKSDNTADSNEMNDNLNI